MAKLLRTKDKVLIALSTFGDLLEEVRDMGGLRSQMYENVYGFIPSNIKKESYKYSLNQMLKSDLMEKVIIKGNPVLRISAKGKGKLNRDFPLFNLQDKTWDKKWRVLIFDIPEKYHWKRDSLRNKIKKLGFGMVQQSVWISPHPFEEDVIDYVKNLGMGEYVLLFISGRTDIGNIEEKVGDIWKLEEINGEYKKLYDKYDYNVYLEVLSKDPFLPRELLPKDWWGTKLRKSLASKK